MELIYIVIFVVFFVVVTQLRSVATVDEVRLKSEQILFVNEIDIYSRARP